MDCSRQKLSSTQREKKNLQIELVMRTAEVSCDACGAWGVRMLHRYQVNYHHSRSLTSPTPKTLLSCGVTLWNFEGWNPYHQYKTWRKASHIVFQSKWKKKNCNNNEKKNKTFISQVLDAKSSLFPGSGISVSSADWWHCTSKRGRGRCVEIFEVTGLPTMTR